MTSNKGRNAAEEMAGKVKQGVGDAVGDEKLRREGEIDQAKANLKQAAENVKDAFTGDEDRKL